MSTPFDPPHPTPEKPMLVDAYTHCGLEKFQPLPAVAAAMAAAGVTRAVLVQHLGQYDNSYIRDCVAAAPDRYAGVGMVDPADPDAEATLDAVLAEGILTGIRMTGEMVAADPERAASVVRRGLHCVLYCPDGVAAVADILRRVAAEAVGTARIIVCHLGSPVVSEGRCQRGEDLLALADVERILVTLSGAGMACPYPHAPLREHVGALVAHFGADRIMWGSNFPVCGGVSEYVADLDLLRADSWGLGPAVLPALTGATAARVWFP